LKQRLLRNYRTAIPHWYNNKVQLLLPLTLSGTCQCHFFCHFLSGKPNKAPLRRKSYVVDSKTNNCAVSHSFAFRFGC
jgi:Domain of unknown function (DUF3825)